MENTDKPLVNRVAASGLITINLEEFLPEGEVLPFDLKDYLFMGLILQEKDFRTALDEHDWKKYEGKNLAVFCSADAIIPLWAYMLVVRHAAPFARLVLQCTPADFEKLAVQNAISKVDFKKYEGKRVVIKGCGDKEVPAFAYAEFTRNLLPLAQSILYGEPCSTVPIFKKAKD